MRIGFLHVPGLPEQAARHPGQPSMATATMVTALRAAIAAIVANATDLRVTEGATH
jgi:pyroglutamyl-peptidase